MNEDSPTPKQFEQLDYSVGPNNLNNSMNKKRRSGESIVSKPRKSGEFITQVVKKFNRESSGSNQQDNST